MRQPKNISHLIKATLHLCIKKTLENRPYTHSTIFSYPFSEADCEKRVRRRLPKSDTGVCIQMSTIVMCRGSRRFFKKCPLRNAKAVGRLANALDSRSLSFRLIFEYDNCAKVAKARIFSMARLFIICGFWTIMNYLYRIIYEIN